MKNEIGDLGESLFKVAITREYKFRPLYLGEKWPISDFYIELIGTNKTMFFIVQIKATDKGFWANGNLKVNLPKKKLHELNSYYCPTYLAGVDNTSGRVFMTAINKNSRKGISSLPATFELTTANRKILYDEIERFWSNSNIESYKRAFKHKVK